MGGATIHARTLGLVRPISGFAVALPRAGVELESRSLDDSQLRSHFTGILGTARYIGIWFHGDRAFLDEVEVVTERADALARAAVRNQHAVFDFAADRVIYCRDRSHDDPDLRLAERSEAE